MTVLRDTLILTIVCALLYAPGAASIPLYTRGEPREAQVVRTLATGGAWLVPVRGNGKLTRKPPLYYWLGAAGWTLLPDRPEAAVRLPSIVGGTVGVFATYGTATLAFGAPAALPAAVVLGTAFEWLRASTRARIDMTLAAPLALLLLAWAGALTGRA
jgi:4-amino-4-deoxy-L-arabinose transferase-like glycosyltransferase